MNNGTHEHGAVLVTSLLMLVVLTLLAVSSIRASSVNLLIVDNMQSQKEAQALADRAVADVLSDSSAFITPTAQTLTYDGVEVNVTASECIASQIASGYSVVWGGIPPEDTVWEFSATAANTSGGAGARVHQGVQIRMTAGNCL